MSAIENTGRQTDSSHALPELAEAGDHRQDGQAEAAQHLKARLHTATWFMMILLLVSLGAAVFVPARGKAALLTAAALLALAIAVLELAGSNRPPKPVPLQDSDLVDIFRSALVGNWTVDGKTYVLRLDGARRLVALPSNGQEVDPVMVLTRGTKLRESADPVDEPQSKKGDTAAPLQQEVEEPKHA